MQFMFHQSPARLSFCFLCSMLLGITLVFPDLSFANKSKLLGFGFFSVASTATSYVSPLHSSGSLPASEADAQMLIPTAGTLRKLRVISAAPATESAVYTLRKNGSDTSLAVTMTTTDQSNTSDSVSVVAGDLIALKIYGGNPGINALNRFHLEFQSTTPGETILSFSTPSGVSLPANTRFTGIHNYAAAAPISATATDVQFVMPFDGTIKNLRALLATAPGAGTSRTLLVSVNGATTGDLSLTISDADTTGSNTTDTVSVVAGDRIAIYSTVSGAAAMSGAKISAVLVPSNPGDFLIPYVISNTNISTATTYLPFSGFRGAPNGTETQVQGMGYSDFQITSARVYLTVAPGVGTSRVFKLREDTADASVPFTMTVSDANQTASATGTFTPADYSDLATVASVTGSPADSKVMISYTGYITPPSARNKGGDFMPFFQ